MHPSIAALATMSDADLESYITELRTLSSDAGEDFTGPYRNRKTLAEEILSTRRRTAALEATPEFQPVVTDHNEDGTPAYTFEPWTDGHAVGFKVARHADGAVTYIYLNPSTETYSDGKFNPDVFVYSGPDGDPAKDDVPHHFYNIEWEEPTK